MSEQHVTEIWKPIPSFPGYEASSLGRIRRSGSTRIRKACPDRNGYLHVCMHYKNPLVHRLVLEAFVGLRPKGKGGCHGNGDPSDNRLSNLRWDTQRNNIREKYKHGTMPLGEKHFNAVMTEADVRNIYNERARGIPLRDVAAKYNISITTASRICLGLSWAHLKLAPFRKSKLRATPAQVDTMRQLRASGLSFEEIGRRTGFSTMVVWKRCHTVDTANG